MKIGDPLDRSTDHGPQNHRAHLESLLDYCKTGVKEGATLVYGGKQCDRPGNNITCSEGAALLCSPTWRYEALQESSLGCNGVQRPKEQTLLLLLSIEDVK